MNSTAPRKNKIVLTDYNYRRDIETRLAMARLTTEMVTVLREILDSSLKMSVRQLAETLEVSFIELLPVLEELKELKLFVLQGDTLVVDKEMRKYLESQIIKLEPDYEMGMDFIQSLLAKVPINAIPNWYAISRTCDHLFSSLVEKYLETPQIYQRYLDELVIDCPHAMKIGKDVLKSENFYLTAAEVMKKHGLTHEQLEEAVLHLEFHFVCCLSYKKSNDQWEEVITPFHEWQEYLKFAKENVPSPINPAEVVRDYADDFGFLNQLAEHVKRKISVSEKVVAKMLLLHLLEETPGCLEHSQRTEHWLSLPLHEQAATLYRRMLHHPYVNELFTDRDLRHVQKSLKRITKAGWIYFDDFFKGFTRAIGKIEPIALRNKGKRWRYNIPVYTKQEKDFVFHAIFETFLQVGIVATGTHENKPCFCVTPFGRLSLDD